MIEARCSYRRQAFVAVKGMMPPLRRRQRPPLWIMLLKDDPESLALMEEFNVALQAIHDKGIHEEIIAEYEQ